MHIHEIHDLSNSYVINLLKSNLSTIVDADIIKNYHPDYANFSGNLFYILEQGRYKLGKGKYFVITDAGDYVGSAGWNEYDYDTDIAIVLSRMFINKKYRSNFYIGKLVLPKMLNETLTYKKVWITTNNYNKAIYNWFERNSLNKLPSMQKWPEIYENFRPIGKKVIYYTEQDVVELTRIQNDQR